MKNTTQNISSKTVRKTSRILVGSVTALLAFSTGAAQANTVTLSNGHNLTTGIAPGDILSLEGVPAGGTLILDNYQLLRVNGNGNANPGFGTGSYIQQIICKPRRTGLA